MFWPLDIASVKVRYDQYDSILTLAHSITAHDKFSVAPDVFANNRLSVNLISDTSLAALVDLIADDGQTPATLLPQYLVDPDYGQSLSMTKALYQYRRKDQGIPDKTFYEWMQMKAIICPVF